MTEYEIIDRKTYPAKLPERGAPSVRFDRANGIVYFSLRACRLLGIQSGDRVQVLKNPRVPTEIGFQKTENENGFTVYGNRSGLSFAAAGLVRAVITIFGEPTRITLQIGTEKRDGAYWVIPKSGITR